jgi:fructose-1,6-bisphosphatase/inositol monophosphatase family enzyme
MRRPPDAGVEKRASWDAGEMDAGAWLEVCREARGAVERALESMPTRAEREPAVGAGMGGDETTAVDAAAEAAVVEVLERVANAGIAFTLVSEELGERAFGHGDARLHVVLDPIDGSLNAKRGIPPPWATSSARTSTISGRARSGRPFAEKARA